MIMSLYIICTVLPIVNLMMSGSQTESCQMTKRMSIVDHTGIDRQPFALLSITLHNSMTIENVK